MVSNKKKTSDKLSILRGREGLRFAIMIVLAVIVGAIALGSLDKFASPTETETDPISTTIPEIKLPPIDRKILAEAKDSNAIQRLETEPSVYEHLLAAAAYIVPGSLQAMGLEEGSVATLRAQSDKLRGQPFAFEGTIVDLRAPAKIPGVDTWKKTEGMLETESGEHVFFAVLDAIPESLGLGKFARVEGFFFKLRDFKFPRRYDEVPHIVGFALRPGFRKFESVETLDKNVLGSVRDDVKEPATVHADALYHVTSWLQNKEDDGLRASAKDLERSDVDKMLAATTDSPRGKVFRVLAELYDAQTRLAEPNPLGIRYWTRAWVKHANQETIQVNIPGRIEGEWRTGDYVVFYGAFLQRIWYESGYDREGERIERIVPLFVANNMYPWKVVDNPDNLWIRLALGFVSVLLIGAVSFLVIRDRKAEQEVRDRLLDQRRRRRLRKDR